MIGRNFWRDFEKWNFDIFGCAYFACIFDQVGGQIWTRVSEVYFRPRYAQLQACIKSPLSRRVWELSVETWLTCWRKAVKMRVFWGSNLTCPAFNYKQCQQTFPAGGMVGGSRESFQRKVANPIFLEQCACESEWALSASIFKAGCLVGSVFQGAAK